MIREATLDDIPQMTAMGLAMHIESDYSSVPFEVHSVRVTLEMSMEEINQCCFVYETDGELKGMMLAAAVPFMFNYDELRSSDFLFYIAPEARGGRAAVALEKAYRAWAISRGVRPDWVGLGVTTGNKNAGEFYERIGYTQCGEIYRRTEEK